MAKDAFVDYIIVGGGTSGLVIAHRLADETDATVLVLEAGRDSGCAPDVLVPGKYIHQLENDDDGLWQQPTVSQEQLNGRSITFVRGRQVGGSSAINYMAMARGPADDYDEWARQTGDDAWSWKNVVPRMRAMEDFDPRPPKGFEHLAAPDPANHGNGGPIKLGFGDEMTPGVEKFVRACQQKGLELCPDINSGNPIGVGLAQFNVRGGVRQYAANAYLSDEFRASHPNLRIQTQTSVSRLLVRENKVVGVRARGKGRCDDADIFCSKEVIICAGTFATPQLLLLSGIGASKTVQKLGVPQVRHLPGVGRGMLDHSILTVEFQVKDPSLDFSKLFESADILRAAEAQYEIDRTGPLSTFGSSGSVAFPKIGRLRHADEFKALPEEVRRRLVHPQRPDAEIWLGSGRAAYRGPVNPGQAFITFELLLQNNLSQGIVTVAQSKNGDHALEIDPRFLDHPYDRRIAIETVRTALEISRAEAYVDEIEAMVHGPESDTDEAILEFVRANLGQGYHSVGTCRMGSEDDGINVVDKDFKVYGLAGLRVADLSVCPVMTCNHTQINAYLIGDRCAESLIESWTLAKGH